jgi:hypothetical protein
MAQLVQGIGGVGDQLTQKNLGVRIKGMDDQLQQLADFGLKFTFWHRPSLSTKTSGTQKRLSRVRRGLPDIRL